MVRKLYWYLFLRDLNESLVKPSNGQGLSVKKRLMQDFSVLMLISYVFYIFSPYLPIAADIIAHTFWKEEHLQAAHYMHGGNHVGIEIIKLEKRTGRESANSTQKDELESLSHISGVDILLDFPTERIIERVYALLNIFTPTIYCDIDYPPPKI